MKPFFISYKNFNITWFTVFALISIIMSYMLTVILSKEYGEDKNQIEDIFMILLIIGFIGARLGYVLMNINLYKDNIFSIFKLSHYNLSLLWGTFFGLLALKVLSNKYIIPFKKLFKIFVIPFYFSMAIGIWVLKFDIILASMVGVVNNSIKILYLSLLFLIAMVLELILSKNLEKKNITTIIFIIVLLLYYII